MFHDKWKLYEIQILFYFFFFFFNFILFLNFT